MSFTLIGKHEKDSRNNRDGYVTAMLDLMEKDSKVMLTATSRTASIPASWLRLSRSRP